MSVRLALLDRDLFVGDLLSLRHGSSVSDLGSAVVSVDVPVPDDLDRPVVIGSFDGRFDQAVFFDESTVERTILFFSMPMEPQTIKTVLDGTLSVTLDRELKMRIAAYRRACS